MQSRMAEIEAEDAFPPFGIAATAPAFPPSGIRPTSRAAAEAAAPENEEDTVGEGGAASDTEGGSAMAAEEAATAAAVAAAGAAADAARKEVEMGQAREAEAEAAATGEVVAAAAAAAAEGAAAAAAGAAEIELAAAAVVRASAEVQAAARVQAAAEARAAASVQAAARVQAALAALPATHTPPPVLPVALPKKRYVPPRGASGGANTGGLPGGCSVDTGGGPGGHREDTGGGTADATGGGLTDSVPAHKAAAGAAALSLPPTALAPPAVFPASAAEIPAPCGDPTYDDSTPPGSDALHSPARDTAGGAEAPTAGESLVRSCLSGLDIAGGDGPTNGLLRSCGPDTKELPVAATNPSVSLLRSCLSGLQLSRLLGFSSSAHDHVHWQPANVAPPTGRLFYTTADLIAVDDLHGSTEFLPSGAGVVSTFSASADNTRLVVGSGEDGPTCVWDIGGGRPPELILKLPGHIGGTQAVAFCGKDAVASLGLSDCQLLVQLTGGPGALAVSISATLPPLQNALACSAGGEEISVGGPDGLLSWRVERRGSAATGLVGRLVPAPPLPCQQHVAPPGISPGRPSLSCLCYLDPPPFLIGGDSHGVVHLWGGDASAALASWHVGLGGPAEIDLMHATRIPSGGSGGGGSKGGSGGSEGIRGGKGEVPTVSLSSLLPLVVPTPPTDISFPLSTPTPTRPGITPPPTSAPPPLQWHVIIAGSGRAHTTLRFLLTIPLRAPGGASPPAPPPTLELLGAISLDADATAMCFPPPGIQGVVGTSAGTLYHVHWAARGADATTNGQNFASSPPGPAMSTTATANGQPQPAAARRAGPAAVATAIVSAPPPPVRQVAALVDTAGGPTLAHTEGGGTPTDTAGGGSLLLAAVSASAEAGGLLLWSAAAAGAPLMRVTHPAAEEATCVAMAALGDVKAKRCAIGFADGEPLISRFPPCP
jgi:hypothetical protein